jgi:hypothetical protein
MPTDLKNSKWMYAKAVMLLTIGTLSFGLLLLPQPLWGRISLQILMIWAFARTYYFAFYVMEHYIDASCKYSGILAFLRHLATRRNQCPK